MTAASLRVGDGISEVDAIPFGDGYRIVVERRRYRQTAAQSAFLHMVLVAAVLVVLTRAHRSTGARRRAFKQTGL